MRLPDDTILAVIRELGSNGNPVRGSAVRRVLAERFGCRASTDRVYRLMRKHEREQLTSSERQRAEAAEREVVSLQAELAEVRAALKEALARLDTSEYRAVERLRAELEKVKAELEKARAELKAAIERAELAEYREEAHFNMRARELHELRQQVAYYKSAERRREQAEAAAERLETLRALTRARQEVAKLRRVLEANGIELE